MGTKTHAECWRYFFATQESKIDRSRARFEIDQIIKQLGPSSEKRQPINPIDPNRTVATSTVTKTLLWDSSLAYEAALNIGFLQKYQRLTNLVHWQGFAFGRWPVGIVGGKIWGFVRNTRPADHFWVSITYEANGKLTFFDFLIGPFDPFKFKAPDLDWSTNLKSKIEPINTSEGTYLSAKDLILDRTTAALFTEMATSVQELYFNNL